MSTLEVKGDIKAVAKAAKKMRETARKVFRDVGEAGELIVRIEAPELTGRLRASIISIGTESEIRIMPTVEYAGYVEEKTRFMTRAAERIFQRLLDRMDEIG